MHIVFGLGNPGRQYQFTRHNIGFLLLDYFQEYYKIPFQPGKGDYYFTRLEIDGEDILLVKPTTYMNLSGVAIRQVLEQYPVPLQDVLVVVDDFQLPFGTLRFRKKGSDGGHNGLKSVIYYLESEEFPRLRFGIGDHFENAAEHVLSPFNQHELKKLEELLPVARQGVLVWVKEGIEQAMNRFNRNFFEAKIN
ncbi:aminoacyl-tRNA hydrolase [Caldithrix abyssi]